LLRDLSPSDYWRKYISFPRAGTLHCNARYHFGVIELITEWPKAAATIAAGLMVTPQALEILILQGI
jgi:hypothetical protein